jgi:AhpD family alkylhydroperoxidase
MSETFNIYQSDNAPQEAKATLQNVESQMQFIPNLFGIMAEAPSLLNGYLQLDTLFAQTSFNETEKQVILLSISYSNHCDYCMAAHSTMAQMKNVNDKIIEALRNGKTLEDEKLEALRQYVKATVESRGYPSQTVLNNFYQAGYGNRQALEVILGIGLKTLSNYTNHLAHTPLDEPFKGQKWNKET